MPAKKKLTLKRPGSSAGTTYKHQMPTRSSNSASADRQRAGRRRAAARLHSRLAEYGARRMDEANGMPFSSIPPIQLINQKNYFTDYLKRDEQLWMVRRMKARVTENRQARKRHQTGRASAVSAATGVGSSGVSSAVNSSTEEDAEEDTEDTPDNIIVIQPGSENVRIGRASDPTPTLVKNLVAWRKPDGESSAADATGEQSTASNIEDNGTGEKPQVPDPVRKKDADGLVTVESENFEQDRRKVTASFRERMRYYKRRILPNSRESCSRFNARVQPEKIPAHQDSHDVEYIYSKDTSAQCIVGNDVMRIGDLDHWQVRSPFLAGSGFNDRDESYKTPGEVLGDIEALLSHTLADKFGLKTRHARHGYGCILVIPDMYSKAYVEQMLQILLVGLGMRHVALIQEGMAATFGAGTSTGCVVDIGATTTTVCCIEQGSVIPNSQVVLSYGSADVTRFFIKNLLAQQFPYSKINLHDFYDWQLANTIKEGMATFDDANVAVHVQNFVQRRPGQITRKYPVKVFDEVIVAPMGMFYPKVFAEAEKTDEDEGDGTTTAGTTDGIVCNIPTSRIILGKIAPAKRVRAQGLLTSRAGIFEGAPNADPVSLAQQMGHEGKSICKMKLKDVCELIVEMAREADSNGNSSSTAEKAGKVFTADRSMESTTAQMRTNMSALDEAVIQSITMAGYDDIEKLEALYSNIALVGGGSKIDGIDTMMVDRLNLARPAILGCNKLAAITKLVKGWYNEFEASHKKDDDDDDDKQVPSFELSRTQLQRITNMVNNSQLLGIEILPNADIDPAIMSWKGGAVFARLKIVGELWIDDDDWDRLGSRCMNYVSLFSY